LISYNGFIIPAIEEGEEIPPVIIAQLYIISDRGFQEWISCSNRCRIAISNERGQVVIRRPADPFAVGQLQF
jgi:hypothetical protein